MTSNILAAYEQDIEQRVFGLEPGNNTGYEVRSHEVAAGTIYQDNRVRVEAFQVNHGTWEALGYRFRAPDRTIVIAGDTAPFEGYVEEYRDCDVLIHEVYSTEGLGQESEDWRRYHSSMHTGANELAEMASRTRPGLVILYHQLFFDASEQELLQEVQAGYEGKVVSGRDLEVY